MTAMDKSFFEKYQVKLGEKDALRLMKCQLHKVKELYKEDPESEDYLEALCVLKDQIEDFFESKGLEMARFYS